MPVFQPTFREMNPVRKVPVAGWFTNRPYNGFLWFMAEPAVHGHEEISGPTENKTNSRGKSPVAKRIHNIMIPLRVIFKDACRGV